MRMRICRLGMTHWKDTSLRSVWLNFLSPWTGFRVFVANEFSEKLIISFALLSIEGWVLVQQYKTPTPEESISNQQEREMNLQAGAWFNRKIFRYRSIWRKTTRHSEGSARRIYIKSTRNSINIAIWVYVKTKSEFMKIIPLWNGWAFCIFA